MIIQKIERYKDTLAVLVSSDTASCAVELSVDVLLDDAGELVSIDLDNIQALAQVAPDWPEAVNYLLECASEWICSAGGV